MIKILLVLLLLLASGCTQSLYMQGRKSADEGRYDEAVDILYRDIQKNPGSYEAWRELGVAYYKKGDLLKAEDALKQANNIQPDARSNLYMGLIFEQRKQYDQAIGAYSSSLNMESDKKTGQMLRSYLNRLIALKMKEDARKTIADENAIDVASIPDNSIAVVDFDGSHLSPELAPIAKGLAEFTAGDLSKVSSLKVVDRMKLDAILNELKLSSSQYANPATSPRMGRLLGSRNVVTGSVLDIGEGGIRLDGAIVNTVDSATEMTAPTEGKVQNFFAVQKDFVFKIIDSLGINLTKEERDAIEEVPTESFLAFMAYCRGLDYQSRGMPDAARQEFQTAAGQDKNFTQAAGKLQAMAPGGPDSFEGFESSVTEASEKALEVTGLDAAQVSNIINSGFIQNYIDFDRFGYIPFRPPVLLDEGVIVIIRGDLDAQ
ncbi:MAG: tetratricopeptide repeat protein [Candidatus Zixiibacteriota bacterium]